MHNNRSRKHKILLDTWEPLVCLLAFFLLVSLIPAAVSFQMQSISSYGTITPPARARSDFLAYNGLEHLPVGKNWGRSLISDWKDWQAGPATAGGVDCWYQPVGGCGYAEVVSSFTDSYGYSPPNMGAKVVRFVKDQGGSSGSVRFRLEFTHLHQHDFLYDKIYQSTWYYLPQDYIRTSDHWTAFWHFKEFCYQNIGGWDNSNYETGITINKASGDPVGGSSTSWRMAVGHPDWGAAPCLEADYSIYSDYYVEHVKASHAIVEVNPHPLPIGRWFRLEVWLQREDASDTGEFTVWITDPNCPDPAKRNCTILFSAQNVRIRWFDGQVNCDYMMLYYYGAEGWHYADEIYVYDYNAHGG